MRRFLFRYTVLVIVFGLLATLGATAAPHAAARTISAASRPHLAGSSSDYDVTIHIDNYVVVEGWLHLVYAATGTNAKGTFLDNLAGGKKYPATYSGATGETTLNTSYGKFIIGLDGSVSYPPRFGAGGRGSAIIGAHNYGIATYPTFSATAVQGYGQRIDGQLTLTFDNFSTGAPEDNYVVPDNPKAGIQSRIVGTIGGKAFVAPITQAALFQHTADSVGSYTVIFTVKIAGQVYHFQSFYRDTSGSWGVYEGLAYADSPGTHGVVYYWRAS